MIVHAWKLLLLLYFDAITAQNECNSRLLPNTESPVCVCNATYCDTIPPVEKVPSSQYVLYTTSKLGERLKKDVQSFSNSTMNSTIIEIDIEKEYQTIIGWGGAITDAAGINIKSLSVDAQENLLKSYFSKEGLEYNIVRVPIGSTDFSLSNYTYDDGKDDPKLENFALAKEDLEYKIPLLQHAKDFSNNTLKLLASAWMAPDWMQIDEKQGFIKKSMHQVWANYHLKFLKSYKEHGLDFWAITTGNEPITYSNFPFVPFVKWRPKAQCIWITSNLRPTLENSEFSNLKVLTMDDWRSTLLYSLDQVLSCKNAKKFVQGIALHWYRDRLFPPILLDITHDKYPDKFIFYTEACVKKFPLGIQYGSWKHARSYAENILQNLNHWSTGWVDWNIALNMEGGPTYLHNEVNSPIFIDASKGEFYKQPMYYILGHFSKFISQGSIRIEHKCMNENLLVASLKRPDGGIGIVILNKENKEVPVAINAKGKYININVMAESIITILYW